MTRRRVPQALEIRYHLSPIGFDGADIRDGVLNADKNGSFVLDVTTMQKGTYVLWVKSPIYLARSTEVELNYNEFIPVNPSLIVGDANDDNVVNDQDQAIVKAKFGTDDPSADFNGDKVVNFSRTQIFSAVTSRKWAILSLSSKGWGFRQLWGTKV